jgi:restriction endonuclease S subunit
MFGDPIINSKKWEIKNLKNLSTKILSGNTPKGGREVYVKKGITFFRSQNVWRRRLELDNIAYIDEKTHQKMKNSSLKYNDLLITKTGRFNTENSSLGRTAIFLGKDDSANINGHVYLIRLNKEINNQFVLFILASDEYRNYIRSVCVGGIDKRQINKTHLEEFPIIVPPKPLQDKFAEIVEQIETLKQHQTKSKQEIEILFNKTMQQAFQGEL